MEQVKRFETPVGERAYFYASSMRKAVNVMDYGLQWPHAGKKDGRLFFTDPSGRSVYPVACPRDLRRVAKGTLVYILSNDSEITTADYSRIFAECRSLGLVIRGMRG